MRPGQLTPENGGDGGGRAPGRRASMRPGQLTPENRCASPARATCGRSFNEAGAINPGKRRYLYLFETKDKSRVISSNTEI